MRVKCVETISSRGLIEDNEDSLYCSSKMAIVMDGATSLFKEGIPPRYLVDNFIESIIYLADEKLTLKELVSKVIIKVREKFVKDFGTLPEDRSMWLSASSSIVMVRNGYLEYIVFGDSPIILYTKKGEPIIVRDENIVKLDEKAIKLIYSYVLKGFDFFEAREKAMPILREHRRMLCKKGGYSSVSFDQSCVDMALYGRVKINELRYVLMATDGFTRIVDVFKYIKDYKTLLNEIRTKGFAKLLVKMRDMEVKDWDCRLFPRLSIIDDATALLLKIE